LKRRSEKHHAIDHLTLVDTAAVFVDEARRQSGTHEDPGTACQPG